MSKNQSLSDQLQDVFEKILKGHITNQMIAEVFSRLRLKDYNYTDIKTALLKAGDIEPTIKTEVYTREEIMRIFNWEDRALAENLKKWGLPHSSKKKYYDIASIHEAAKKAGWRHDAENGLWFKPKPNKKISS
jgi:hypothetical protein